MTPTILSQLNLYRRPLGVCFVALLALYMQLVMQLSAGVLLPAWKADFNIDSAHAGLLAASYYYVYLLLQVPAGNLVDRWGARKLLSLGCLVSASGCAVLAHSQQFLMAEAGRLVMGAGLSFAFVGLLYLLSRWFHERHFPIVLGLFEMLALSLTVATEWYLPDLIPKLGWRLFTEYLGGALVILSTVIFRVVRDQPGTQSLTPTVPWSLMLRQTLYLTKHPLAWCLGLYAGAMFAMLTAFGGVWAVPFFQHHFDIDVIRATRMGSAMLFGTVCVIALVGALAPKLSNRLQWMTFAGCASALLLAWVVWGAPLAALAPALIALGALMSFYVLAFVVMQNQLPFHLQGTGVGLLNMICMVVTPLMQTGIGWGYDAFRHHSQGWTSIHAYPLSISALCVLLVLTSLSLQWLHRRPQLDFQ